MEKLDVHAIHDWVTTWVVDQILVVLFLHKHSWLLNQEFRLEPLNKLQVRIWQLLKLLLANEYLVVAIAYVVRKFGMHLEDHAALVKNRRHRVSLRLLDDEVLMIVAYSW